MIDVLSVWRGQLISESSTFQGAQYSLLVLCVSCRTFDASADGYGRGEGAAVLCLASAASEIATHAAAVIRIAGSGVNQDGRSSGLTAPHGPSQSRLIATALQSAGMAASELGYVAVHGTGQMPLCMCYHPPEWLLKPEHQEILISMHQQHGDKEHGY